MVVEIDPEMFFVLHGKFASLWIDLKQSRDIRSACAYVQDVKFRANPLCGRRDTGEKLLYFRGKVPFPSYKF